MGKAPGEAFLLDSRHRKPTYTDQGIREWPEQGIRVSQDKQKALEDCRQLYVCFKKLKKQIESLSPPSSPENGPERSETSASSKSANNGTPFCQGVLLVLDNLLSPGEVKHDDNLKYFKDEEWIKLKGLGVGDTGVVSEAQDLTTKYMCAVKQISFEKFEPYEGFAWSQLNHKNIPKLYGIVREVNADTGDAGKVFLFCEEIKNHKPFLEFIEEDCKEWPSFFLKEFINTVEKQVNSAVDHIHSQGLAHNDLTLNNVVIEDFDKGNDRKAWVIDFGRTTPINEYDKNLDKIVVNQLIEEAQKMLKEKEKEEKERSEEIAAGMKDLEVEGAAGAASNYLHKAGPPKSDNSMDGRGKKVEGSRFTWVKSGGTSSAASLSPSPSTSKADDLSEDDIQDQSTIAAINKNLEKNPSNQIPSNENVPREDPKHQPVSEIQPSRMDNQ